MARFKAVSHCFAGDINKSRHDEPTIPTTQTNLFPVFKNSVSVNMLVLTDSSCQTSADFVPTSNLSRINETYI